MLASLPCCCCVNTAFVPIESFSSRVSKYELECADVVDQLPNSIPNSNVQHQNGTQIGMLKVKTWELRHLSLGDVEIVNCAHRSWWIGVVCDELSSGSSFCRRYSRRGRSAASVARPNGCLNTGTWTAPIARHGCMVDERSMGRTTG